MKILITDKIHEKGIKVLQENGFIIEKKFDLSPNDLKNRIGDYDGIIVRSATKLNAEVLEKGKKLKFIGRAGVGLDNIDLEKCQELNITVLNTPKAPSVSVAELTIGLMISLLRYIPKANISMHCGEWHKSQLLGETLYGKTLGIIGFGNIGQEVAKRLESFKMKIGIFDISKECLKMGKDLGYKIYESIEGLIKESQIITLHLPVSNRTNRLIDESCFNLMNDDTLLINTARGELIDEKALLKALENNLIGGAALDVYSKEPLGEHDLCNYEENLILTPHIGSQTIETQIHASSMIAQKIIDFFNEMKEG